MTPVRGPIAVVIPTLDEERELPLTLAALRTSPVPLEIVVADGGSSDATSALAEAAGVRVVHAPPGRAWQMNAGAAATTGDPLLFLHADTRLGAPHLAALVSALGDPGVAFGSFPIAMDVDSPVMRLIAAGANLRTRLDRTPYGDQGLFVRRSAFTAVGGYPEVPILEDVMLGRLLRKHGRFAFLPGPHVLTSSRRWRAGGVARTTVCNVMIRILWEIGVAPARLTALRAQRAACSPPARPATIRPGAAR